MKDSLKYKLFVTFCLMFVALLSLSFGFFVGASRTNGNIAYWVFKSIAIIYLVVLLILVWTRNSISNILALSVGGIIIQLVPLLLRIGYIGEQPAVPVLVIYIAAILMFVILVSSILFSISSNKFKHDEDRAKPSSNSL